ncbi:MAG: 1-(5-phosphoribosyl)-5-[(5-phosphoribosylamino)methylideneamino] imidazole-4-carboxamide isomerase [Pseudomonadota bacterium]
MLLIPAIDLKDGRCVRLKQGRADDVTVFSDDPVAMVERWRSAGGRRLHIVDLDGAFEGAPRNQALIERMVAAAGDMPVQVGGGIRSAKIIDGYFAAGVQFAIVGTAAIENRDFLIEVSERWPGRIILGLDARGDALATAGWVESAGSALGLARAASRLPLAGIVYTDIERDGLLGGVNVAATVQMAETSGLPVIASGGVASLDDLRALVAGFASSGGELLGVITGRAIYDGRLDVTAGQRLLDASSRG